MDNNSLEVPSQKSLSLIAPLVALASLGPGMGMPQAWGSSLRHRPFSCEDAIKAYKAVMGVHLSESGVDYVAPITDVLGQPS